MRDSLLDPVLLSTSYLCANAFPFLSSLMAREKRIENREKMEADPQLSLYEKNIFAQGTYSNCF
jgi:hypothetical protein